jgi:hypothetical protein
LANPDSEFFIKLASGEKVFCLDIFLSLSKVRNLVNKAFMGLSKLTGSEQKEYLNLRQKFLTELADQLEVLVDPDNRTEIMATGKITEEQIAGLIGIKIAIRKINK